METRVRPTLGNNWLLKLRWMRKLNLPSCASLVVFGLEELVFGLDEFLELKFVM
jgi:hypothetical protein